MSADGDGLVRRESTLSGVPSVPKRAPLADQVYHAIKERLMLRLIEPGVPLRTVAIAKELGVSQTPVREALARLAR